MTQSPPAAATVRGRGLAIAGALFGLAWIAFLVSLGASSGGVDSPGDTLGLAMDGAVFAAPFGIALLGTRLRPGVGHGVWLAAGVASLVTPFLLVSPAAMPNVIGAALVLAAGMSGFTGRARGTWTAAATVIVAAAVSFLAFLFLTEASCWYLRAGTWVRAAYSTTIVGTGTCSQAFATTASLATVVGAWFLGAGVLVAVGRRGVEAA